MATRVARSMPLRPILNGLRGMASASVAYPIAERWEGRSVSPKQRAFAREMATPFAARRRRSWQALTDLVRFAGSAVPYYRDLFAKIGFDPDKLARDPQFFQDIPHLTKETIRGEGHRLLRGDHAQFAQHRAKTGGSTGPSAHIYYDQEAADWSSAVTRYARASIGNTHARSELHFASKFPDKFPLRDRVREHLKCFAMNRYNIFFSTFDAQELETIWRQANRIRPHLVHAHPSTIHQLALHVEERYGRGHAFDIFESSGELLSPRQRQKISQVLQCRVIDRYGLAEVGVVAYETTPGRMLFFDPFGWPEILVLDDHDLPAHAGAATGELVVTNLKNRMMPLIRYRTGDIAAMAETSEGFVVRELVGRVHDVLDLAGSKLPTHYVQDVLDRVGGIQEFQIERNGGSPVFRLVPEQGADCAGILQRISDWWGDSVRVEFITPSDLKLQGWRSKFRHIVEPTGPGSP